MRTSTLIRAFVSILAVTLITIAELSGQIKSDWQTLHSKGCSVKYPKDWTLNQSGTMGTVFIVLSPATSPQDNFRENVNLMIQNLGGLNIDLKKFVEISENQIRNLITKSQIIESADENINGNVIHKEIYTGEQGILKLKFEQYYWVKNEQAYILTFTADINQFENYKSIGENILNSFNFE